MMPIKRAPRKTHFTTIPNQGLQDAALSFKARGLLAYMLSMPDDWTFYEREIIEHTTEGRAAVRSALNELVVHGYLTKEQSHDKRGGFGSAVWTVFDTPQLPLVENRSTVKKPVNQQSSVTTTPKHEPLTDYVSSENVSSDNRPLQNTNYTKDLLDKKRTTTTTTPDPLKPLQDFWEGNGFGSMTKNLWDDFAYWFNDFKKLGATDTDAVALIIRGMKECLESGTRARTYKYLNSILNRYSNSKFKTVAEVEADGIDWHSRNTGTRFAAPQHIELSPDQEAAFKRFWGVYPSQVNENKARAAYAVALSAKKADPETLFKAACGYARQVRSEQKEARFIKQAANWINEGLWEADYSIYPASYGDPDFSQADQDNFIKSLGDPDNSHKYDVDPDDPFGYKKRGI